MAFDLLSWAEAVLHYSKFVQFADLLSDSFPIEKS